MDAETFVTALGRLQLAASAAIMVVLLLRPQALRWYGARRSTRRLSPA